MAGDIGRRFGAGRVAAAFRPAVDGHRRGQTPCGDCRAPRRAGRDPRRPLAVGRSPAPATATPARPTYRSFAGRGIGRPGRRLGGRRTFGTRRTADRGPPGRLGCDGLRRRPPAIDHDTAVVCSTPSGSAAGDRGWPPSLVAFTTWETRPPRRRPRGRVQPVDRVIVPSRFNVEVFKASGVKVPLAVVPAYRPDPSSRRVGGSPGDPPVRLLHDRDLDDPKAIPDTVSAFLEAFTAEDDVVLVDPTQHLRTRSRWGAAPPAKARRSPRPRGLATLAPCAGRTRGRRRSRSAPRT